MGKFKDSLKEEIREEVKDIVYEKAKEEVKNKVQTKYDSFRNRFLSFLGIGETRRQRIDKISKEIQEQEDFIISDSVLGILELFTIEYGKTMAEMTGSTVAGREIQPRTKELNENDR